MAKNANAKQRKWMDDITEFANDNLHLLFGDEYSGSAFQRHHVWGRTAKHNKVPIGHEFILPIPFELHDVSSNHVLNVTHHKKCFTSKFGFQRDIFKKMVLHMKSQGYTVPSDDILTAIGSTNA